MVIENLDYEIAACSGWDDECLPTQIQELKDNVALKSKGWQSARCESVYFASGLVDFPSNSEDANGEFGHKDSVLIRSISFCAFRQSAAFGKCRFCLITSKSLPE